MLFNLFARRTAQALITRLHGELVASVRQPMFYTDYGVPDTFEGRFEILVLMTTAIVRRLEGIGDLGKGQKPVGPQLAQDVTDAVFDHLDIALREMGVSDAGMPKKMKTLAGDFAGRSRAYGDALAAKDAIHLATAISRNVYGGRLSPDAPAVVALAAHALAVDQALCEVTMAQVEAGPLVLPPPTRPSAPVGGTP